MSAWHASDTPRAAEAERTAHAALEAAKALEVEHAALQATHASLQAAHAASAEGGAAGGAEGGEAGGADDGRARWRAALYGAGAAWRHVFADGVVPEPVSEEGIMGTLTPMSVVDVLRALEPRWGDVFLDVGVGHGAMLGAMHQAHLGVALRGVDTDAKLVAAARHNLAQLQTHAALEVCSVHTMHHLGDGVTLAYSFCDGLRPADALAVLLAACRATPTLRRACLVHNAGERHALREAADALSRDGERLVHHFKVHQTGSGAQYRAWVLDFEAARRRDEARAPRRRSGSKASRAT